MIVRDWKNVGAACAAVAAAAAGSPAAAESLDRGALEELFGEPVTTSATGAPQRATEAPVNMVIITQEEIRRSGAVDLPGVLERLASVDVMRTSAGQADVSIRGYNTTLAPRLLVLLNGRQVYLDHYGMTNWSAIPVQLAEIRQIEVVTGPNTALFGFNAVAGVVNIITYDTLHDDVDQVTLRAGSNDFAGAGAVWTGRVNERFGVRASVGGFRHSTYANDDAAAAAFYDMPSLDPEARTAAVNTAYQTRLGLRLDAEATWSRSIRTERYADAIFPLLLETNSWRLSAAMDTEWGLLSAQVFSNEAEMGLTNRITVASASLVARPAPAHILRVAAELRRNTLAQVGSEVGYDVYALSTMWNWQASEALSLTAALRHDTLNLERKGVFVPSLPFTNDMYDRTLSELSFNLGALYRLGALDTLRLTAARGVGSPSLLDYGYQFAAPIPPDGTIIVSGAPDVRPTIVYDAQLGWDRTLPGIGGGLRATLFWQRSEDIRSFAARTEIYSFVPLVFALLPDEIGASEMYGVELRLHGGRERWRWDASYSWRQLDDALSAPSSVNQTAFELTTPEHVFTAGAWWSGDSVEVGADVRYTSETQQYGRGTELMGLYEVDDHWQLNARAAWRVSETASLELSGRNLLEPRTQGTGLSPMERSFYLTLNLSF
jgi:outer membrane receptor for ferrienterochelin and colicins